MKYPVKIYAKALCEIISEGGQAKNFLAVLEKNGGRKKLKEIVETAELMACKKKNARKIVVESARELTKPQFDLLKEILKKGDIVEYKINSALIAGIKITANGEMQFDGSLSGKINKIL